MPTGTLQYNISIGGVPIQSTVSCDGDSGKTWGGPQVPITLAAGKAATAWVKTDADTAACNLATSHGYSSGKMAVYWSGGMRYDVDVTVDVNALALDGGSGTDFPESADTTVIVCTHQQINTSIDGDNVSLFAANSKQRGHLHLEDADGDVIADIELAADHPYVWDSASGQANPLTGDPITVCYATNGSTTDSDLRILSLEDSTP